MLSILLSVISINIFTELLDDIHKNMGKDTSFGNTTPNILKEKEMSYLFPAIILFDKIRLFLRGVENFF